MAAAADGRKPPDGTLDDPGPVIGRVRLVLGCGTTSVELIFFGGSFELTGDETVEDVLE